ncbi:acylphosphatase [Macrococcus equi]|uniref:acylphosphatase n=1 Tax=Macrococcus equi TaxID=3395462 RepID=UPI0039BEA822
MKTIHIKVFGQVQGVGFRFYTQQFAHQLEVTGTVQNIDDYVEIFATGNNDNLTKFSDKVLKGASPMSHVTSYELSEIPLKIYKQFKTI